MASVKQGYEGTVQKVFRVVRQGADLPGMSLFGKAGAALASKLRQSGETPQGDSAGPAFRYGEARIVRSQACS